MVYGETFHGRHTAQQQLHWRLKKFWILNSVETETKILHAKFQDHQTSASSEELLHPLELLQDPPSKESWKRSVNKRVNSYWSNKIRDNALLYTSLRYLHVDDYRYGKRHSVLRTIGNACEIQRITTKLKLVTDTYILQCNRSVFNQNQVEVIEKQWTWTWAIKRQIPLL